MDDDSWNGPFNMGEKVNSSDRSEWSPNVSPDGKYFFFMSGRQIERTDSTLKNMNYGKLKDMFMSPGNGNPAVYWIDASFIDSIRTQHINL